MQHADALLLCSQAQLQAALETHKPDAADPFKLILQHAPVQEDTQSVCKLLCVSQGLRSSVQQLLHGQLQLYVEPPKDPYRTQSSTATVQDKCVGDACDITPWLAKHAALLKGLHLQIERVAAPITEEFKAARAPPGRACCCCCGPCKQCDWGDNDHGGEPYAGSCMDPLQEQAIVGALQLAASTGTDFDAGTQRVKLAASQTAGSFFVCAYSM